MPAPEGTPSRRRRPAYRRRLRSRIILSFLWLGFGLTALIAASTVYLRNRVENAVIASALIKNNDAFANGYYRNPDAIGIPFEKIQGRQFSTRKVDRVPPEWRELSNGVHELTNTDPLTGDTRVYKIAVRKDPEYWFFLTYDIAEERESQARLNQALMLSVVVFTLFSLLVGWWAASRVMSPVTELAQRLRRSGRSAEPEALASHFAEDEVGELAKALDDYAERLTDVVKRDREFNADVSHELRTPLAVIRGASELLLAKPDMEDKTRARLQRVQRAEQQCTDLISALLLLSRNERGHGAADVGRLAEQLLDAHRTQLGGKPLTLRMEGAVGQVVVDAPDAAVTVALSNLIGNAVKYTQQGEVVVRLGDNAVDVIDSGPGLSAEDAARLFERGYRGSHAEHTQGGGIGLSIVRRLCALYGWRVRVVPGQEHGVIATLTFGV
ncbi:MAG: HAMP domain-containing sensor histidine kinase [Lysobacteraceae bacterium]